MTSDALQPQPGLLDDEGEAASPADLSLGTGRSLLAMTVFNEQRADYQRSLNGLVEGSLEYAAALDECHERGARRCLELARTNRGLYIKAAQFIASIRGGSGDRGVPGPYVKALSVLADRAPSKPVAEVSASLKDAMSLGSWPESALDADCSLRSIEDEPLASASIAQVHRAVLQDGTAVAVKVQYPELRREAASDIAILREMGAQVKQLSGGHDITWIVDAFEQNLKSELDFEIEASNAEAISRLLAHRSPRVCVPRVFKNLSSKRVLTMELCQDLLGANDPAALRAAGLRVEECAELLCETFAEMIFLHGRVHADPHVGNVYFRALTGENGAVSPQLVLLDHGLYHDLNGDRGVRREFCQYWQACCAKDAAVMSTLGTSLAGKCHKLLPLILSPWFVLASADLSLNEVLAAARGEMPEWVELRDITEFVAAAYSGGTNLVGVLHSLGYVRGLLQDLGFPESRRLACMLRYAMLGDTAHPPPAPGELSGGQRVRLQWHLGLLEWQIRVMAPLADVSVQLTMPRFKCAPCCESRARDRDDAEGMPGVSAVGEEDLPLPLGTSALRSGQVPSRPEGGVEAPDASQALQAASPGSTSPRAGRPEDFAAGVPAKEEEDHAALDSRVDHGLGQTPAALEGPRAEVPRTGVQADAQASNEAQPQASGSASVKPAPKAAAPKGTTKALKKEEEAGEAVKKGEGCETPKVPKEGGSGQQAKAKAKAKPRPKPKPKPKSRPTPKLTKEEAKRLLDRGIKVCEEQGNMKKLKSEINRCKADNDDPLRQQAAIMQEVLPLAQQILGGVLDEFGFDADKLTLAMFQVAMHAAGDDRMQRKIDRMQKLLGLEF